MSAYLLGVGFKADMGTPFRKLVLLKLIDACEEDGTRIFPAVATVAAAAQCSTRTVQRILDEFQASGLLKLVREGGKGRRSTNEYALDIDALFALAKAGWDAFTAGGATQDVVAKGDTVSPLRAPDRVTGETDRVTPETPKGDSRSHTTPPEPSNTPPERERAGARADGEGEGTQDVDGGAVAESRDAIRRAFRKAFREWPSYVADSEPEAIKAWLGLSPEERELATSEIGRYVEAAKAGGRKAVCSFGVYLREKRWEKLPDRAEAPASAAKPAERPKPQGWAAMGGPVWAARLFAVLIAGPDHPDRVPGEIPIVGGEALWLNGQISSAWPSLAAIRALGGRVFGPEWHALKDEMEFVTADSAVHAAWRDEFARHGWPWPKTGMDGLYCPKGGPDGLAAFERRLGDETRATQEAAE